MVHEPVALTLLREGELIAIDLAAADPIVPRSRVQVSDSFLQEVCTEIQRITTMANSRIAAGRIPGSASPLRVYPILDQLKALGRVIWSHLFSEAVRERLSRTSHADILLRLDEQLLHVPWELAFDGQDFLLTKFRIARQVLTRLPSLRQSEGATRPDGPLRMLIIIDPSETLAAAEEEAHALCILLDQYDAVDVSLMGGQQLKTLDLLKALNEADLVHYAGHATFDPANPSNSGWLLHNGLLTASDISRLERPPLLVFSNACQAGATAQWPREYRFEGEAFGVGSGFLLAGVRNFIGTLWVIHDERSAGFAGAFYQRLLQGQTIGESLLQARHWTIGAFGWEEFLWAGYLHYGSPVFRLPVRISPAEEPQAEKPSRTESELAPGSDPSVSALQGETETAHPIASGSEMGPEQIGAPRRRTNLFRALIALALGGGLVAILIVAGVLDRGERAILVPVGTCARGPGDPPCNGEIPAGLCRL